MIIGYSTHSWLRQSIFHKDMDPATDLEQAALQYYRYFVGDLWARWGEDAWMGPWQEVCGRQPGTEPDIVGELKGIGDPRARSSVLMILEIVAKVVAARQALSAAYDDAAVAELAVYGLGDGGAMSGLLVAARRDTGGATFLVFLMD